MPKKRKHYDRQFREGLCGSCMRRGSRSRGSHRIWESNEGTLGIWVNRYRETREGRGELTRDDLEELRRLRRSLDRRRT